MKIQHIKSSNTADKFSSLADITKITGMVRDLFDPISCNNNLINKIVSKMYSNLVPVAVSTTIFSGTIDATHRNVLAVKGTPYLIDLAGDYLNCNDAEHLNGIIVPWLYVRCAKDRYISLNHMPVEFDTSPAEDFTDIDWEAMVASDAEPYSQLRMIVTF